MVRAMEPTLVSVLMTLQAIIVHHYCPRLDEISAGRSRQGRLEIFRSFPGPRYIPFAWILRVQQHHPEHDDSDRGSPAQSDFPFDPGTGEAMQNVQPSREQRCDH